MFYYTMKENSIPNKKVLTQHNNKFRYKVDTKILI